MRTRLDLLIFFCLNASPFLHLQYNRATNHILAPQYINTVLYGRINIVSECERVDLSPVRPSGATLALLDLVSRLSDDPADK